MSSPTMLSRVKEPRYVDGRRLDQAIALARRWASENSGNPFGREQEDVFRWLWELRARRSHKPLRCHLGLHKTVTMGMSGPRFVRTCMLCGTSWTST